MTVTDQGVPAAAVLVSLDDPACEAPALAGNKAATLAVLRRAGFEVPPGVVVPADAVGLPADELPPGLRVALAMVPELLGPGPWAVRSSSTAEDTEAASFAGQFETVLGVEADGLADAVRRVWRSAFGDRAKAYGGGRASGSMAVLIQPMITAAAAGVCFTTDPVSGRNRTVIEAVEGLGERLVSGETTPERWEISEDGALDAPPLATVITAGQAQAIGDLARRVEEHVGSPQDIEWAIADGSLWLLQARPITTLPSDATELIPIPIEVPPGYWMRDTFHEPVPLSPFGRLLLTEQVLDVFPTVFASSASFSTAPKWPSSAGGCTAGRSRWEPRLPAVAEGAHRPAGCCGSSPACIRPSAGAQGRLSEPSNRTCPPPLFAAGPMSGGLTIRRRSTAPGRSISGRSPTRSWRPSSTIVSRSYVIQPTSWSRSRTGSWCTSWPRSAASFCAGTRPGL